MKHSTHRNSTLALVAAVLVGAYFFPPQKGVAECQPLSDAEMSLIVGNVPGNVDSCAKKETASDLECRSPRNSASNCSDFDGNASGCARAHYWPNPDDYCQDGSLEECVGGGSDQNTSCSCSEDAINNPCGRLVMNDCTWNPTTERCTNDCTCESGNVCGGWACTLQQ